jgi:hypothetical protein
MSLKHGASISCGFAIFPADAQAEEPRRRGKQGPHPLDLLPLEPASPRNVRERWP